MKEFVNQNPGGVFGPVNDNGLVGTRIGIAPVYVKRLRWMRMRWELTGRWMGAEIDGVGPLFVEQGQEFAPEGPGDVVLFGGIGQKGDDGPDEVLSHKTSADKGFDVAGLVVRVKGFAALDLVKVGRPGTFSLQNGVVDGCQGRLPPGERGDR